MPAIMSRMHTLIFSALDKLESIKFKSELQKHKMRLILAQMRPVKRAFRSVFMKSVALWDRMI